MNPAIYIAEVEISASVADKINSKHNVTPEEVREAIILRTPLRARWVYDANRGDRLAVVAEGYGGRTLKVLLYPIDVNDGRWSLGTAFPGD